MALAIVNLCTELAPASLNALAHAQASRQSP